VLRDVVRLPGAIAAALVSPTNTDDFGWQRSGQNLSDGEGAWSHMFIGALAPSSEPPPVCAVDLLPARKEECSLTF
jgi:hypothetical protein